MNMFLEQKLWGVFFASLCEIFLPQPLMSSQFIIVKGVILLQCDLYLHMH